MTEEQMGGTAPAAEATASTDSPASDETVATVAVADEPATNESSSNGAAPEGSLPATDEETRAASDDGVAPGADVDEAGDAGNDVVVAPITGEDVEVDQAPAAEVPAAEASVAGEPDAPEAGAAEAQAPAEAQASPDVEAAPAPKPAPRPARTGPEPTTMEELLAEEDTEIRSFKHGDVVEGNVVRIDKDEILVDIGAKSEGVVSNRELFGRNTETQPQLSIGDTVLVYVLQPESPEGHVVLSLRRAGLERKWRAMQEQFEAGVIIEAPVIDHNKGGLIVDCGIRGFVPISQIVDFPRRPQNDQPRDAAQEIAEKLQPYVGRKLRLKILEVNRKANRLILSEKVALYEERREKRDELFSSLQVAQKVTGTVRSIAPFGVFIDLGGIDGLVHKSELSWNKVNNPEAGYKIGDEVEAEVIDINHERGRISLSIRRLQPDPWESTVADFNVGDIIDGTVTKLVNFGAFVRVREGLEGLIHISELSHQRVAHPGDVVHEGQQLKLKIISLESERHRLGLSLKQAEEPTARVVTEAPATPGRERSERRPRGERAYSAHDAVQEPEGGIDNTLAAAFAQVREQLAASEASTEPAPPATAEPAADATGWATDDAATETEASGELDQPAPGDVPDNMSQAADVAVNGALTVGPDTSTEAISNSSEPAPEAAREHTDAADGSNVDAEPEAAAPQREAAAAEPDAAAAEPEAGVAEPEAVRAAEAEAAGE